jgi:hypothetical protein
MDAGYQNTVSGLLRKRGEMLASMADLREQIAVLSNDLESIERFMETLGYEGELQTKADPRSPRGTVLPWWATRLPAPVLGRTRAFYFARTGAAADAHYHRDRFAMGKVGEHEPRLVSTLRSCSGRWCLWYSFLGYLEIARPSQRALGGDLHTHPPHQKCAGSHRVE